MNLANLFSGVNPTPPVQVQVVNPVHPQGTTIPPTAGTTAPATQGTAPNGTLPTDTAVKTETALDQYNDLWKTAPVDPNAPKVDNTIFGEVDGDALLAAAGKIDFAKVITPEMSAAITAGGEGAAQAFAQAMNKVAQLTHAQGAHATTKIVEMAIAKAQEKFSASIPGILRSQNTDNLVKENTVLSHPAAAPMVEGLVNQFKVKFPNDTPQQLKEKAEGYLNHFATTLIATQAEPANAPQKDDMDWIAFLKD